ncbi:hypothetical protein K1719_018648 [Acacia pycnantha]|nr:hypothetical protein K1719_018648 [Acacia pycnantha]
MASKTLKTKTSCRDMERIEEEASCMAEMKLPSSSSSCTCLQGSSRGYPRSSPESDSKDGRFGNYTVKDLSKVQEMNQDQRRHQ